jgi:hypothetical protein
MWDDVRPILDEELARLPAKYRVPLLLCSLEGMTHAEAGQSLGWPTGTVAGRLSRGRELLRSRLIRRGVSVPMVALVAGLATEAATAGAPPELAAATLRSAVALLLAGRSTAAIAPPAVAVLVRGVLRKMLLHRLAVTLSIVVAALATTVGGAAGIWQQPARSSDVAPADAPVPARRALLEDIPGKPSLQLPADPKAVVLRMDRFVDSSKVLRTSLRIYADGRVVAEVPEGVYSVAAQELTRYVQERVAGKYAPPKLETLEGRLPIEDVQELVRFALHDQEFFDSDEAGIKAAIWEKYQSNGAVLDNNDASTSYFRIQTAERTHEVRWSRLIMSLWDFPQVERLQQLFALERRLAREFYVLRAGGPDRIVAVAGKMRELLHSYYLRHPNAPRLTAADFSSVGLLEDGSTLRFAFSRQHEAFEFKPLFEVGIDVPEQGEPRLAYLIPLQNRDQ